MRDIVILLIISLAVFGAEDSWVKVRELKTGTELRIYKKGLRQPILATADDATDEKLMVVVKDAQVAIDKADIERIDARPLKNTPKITKRVEEKSGTTVDTTPGNLPHVQAGPSTSTSTSFSVGSGSKPDFETIYRKGIGAPVAK